MSWKTLHRAAVLLAAANVQAAIIFEVPPVNTWPGPVTFEDFEDQELHYRIRAVGDSAYSSGRMGIQYLVEWKPDVGHNITPGGGYFLDANIDGWNGEVRLIFRTPIDHLRMVLTGLRYPNEYKHSIRVFDGTWHESPFPSGQIQVVGFSGPGHQVTIVEIHGEPNADEGFGCDPVTGANCSMNDSFGIDDMYFRFTSPPPPIPEPGTTWLVAGGLALAAVYRRTHPRRG